MKRILAALITFAFVSTAWAGDKHGAVSKLNYPKTAVRTVLFGDPAKTIYQFLAKTHEPEKSGFKACVTITVAGISCVEDGRWLKKSEEPRYECVLGIDENGVEQDPPAGHFCAMGVGIGVGN